MKSDYDLAIIGSGFSGSLLAMIARRTGRSVMLIDRYAHPRFAIGESTSPLMNLVIGQLADRYDLPRLKPLAAWGAWQQAYPHMAGGLKRGSTFFKHESGARYRAAANRSNQLLVSACPNDEVADTHWLRSDVDYFLLREAVASGADLLDQTGLYSVEMGGGGARLRGKRRGRTVKVRAKLVVDAGGPRGFLGLSLGLRERNFEGFPETQALYSHFVGVHRCDGMPDYEVAGSPPYPMDDAAVHHVFEGGWMWVLRFNNGVTSAGIVVTAELAQELRLAEGESAWRRFLTRFPSIAAQFADARAIRDFTWARRPTYRSEMAAGEGWVMLPSAAAFVDPLFGPGMPTSALGVERLGRLLEEDISGRELNERLQEYGRTTLAEADDTAGFIAGCYAAFPRFEHFASLSMAYFAAAGYCEMARRLGRNHLAQRFLAADHPGFANATVRLSQALRSNGEFDPPLFAAEVKQEIDCLNVTGLCDERKQNWYDVDLEQVVSCAGKLEATPDEMRALLEATRWARTSDNVERQGSDRRELPPIQPDAALDQRLEELTGGAAPAGEMVGSSPAFQLMLEDALNVAPTDAPVLLQGETGTGKELLAYAIHRHSPRSRRPFIVVNCAALPPSLIERALFGSEKDAGPDAPPVKPGAFELAEGGTIFLDAIGEAPPEVQGRFLRVMQGGVPARSGGVEGSLVGARVIAATDRPLDQLVMEGKFRADLFYRLNVFPIALPPLRRRPGDIPLLVRHFIDKYSARFNRPITFVSARSLGALERRPWPGNVRELENLVERAVLSAKGGVLNLVASMAPLGSVMPPDERQSGPLTVIDDGGAKGLVSLEENERAYIRMVLDHTGGRISGPEGAAAILRIPPAALRSRIERMGLTIRPESSR